MDFQAWHDQLPTHKPEHPLVTRARHAFENRRDDYESAFRAWEDEIGTAEEMIAAQQAMIQAENSLRDARELAN